ncbi:MAG: hypothetical protein WCD86_05065 [Ktedonobacteraceae bacterium]
MLAYFLAGAEYVDTLNIEVMRTPLRVDRVYKILLDDETDILDLEFQASGEPDDAERLLEYHAYFHRKHKCPVVSVLVYPFPTTVAVSPLREVQKGGEILVFHFQVIKLWEWHAEHFVQNHAVPMYALLPTMDGANAEMLHKAIDEMVEYYQGSDVKLAREIRWLGIMLRRAEIMPLAEKQEIEERLSMFDDLMERDPKMRKIRAESEARGKAAGLAKGLAEGLAEGEMRGKVKGLAEGETRGKAKGKAEGLQEAVVTIVEGRFPPLADLARQKVRRINTPDALSLMLKSLAAAPNEAAARTLLELLVA